MPYYYRTNVPNILFDTHLKDLKYAELKVLLVIIRQTYGWINPQTKSYKKWDWISQSFFVKKTGLSARAVSNAIDLLVRKNLIHVKGYAGKLLLTPQQRRGEQKLYFSCQLEGASELKHSKAVK